MSINNMLADQPMTPRKNNCLHVRDITLENKDKVIKGDSRC